MQNIGYIHPTLYELRAASHPKVVPRKASWRQATPSKQEITKQQDSLSTLDRYVWGALRGKVWQGR